ncbi:MAG: hypothetical protein IJW13_02175 [Clostridia bacterium]|nr:hypothetical protein [Clostridia bacterium]
MQTLSLKRYKNIIIIFLCGFFAFVLIGIILALIGESKNVVRAIIISSVIGGVTFIPATVYYLASYLTMSKLYKKYTQQKTVITGSCEALWKGMGKVIIRVNNKEIKSPALFFKSEADELVGKNIYYAIIENKLFIYDIE